VHQRDVELRRLRAASPTAMTAWRHAIRASHCRPKIANTPSPGKWLASLSAMTMSSGCGVGARNYFT